MGRQLVHYHCILLYATLRQTAPIETLPLAGYRVLDIGPRVASAFACKHLAEMGADVVRVEPPQPDPVRLAPGAAAKPAHEWVAVHLYVNGGKRSLALDYYTTEGRETLRRLLGAADLVVNGHPPTESEQLDLGPTQVNAANANALVVSVTSWGLDGPYRDLLGDNDLMLALGGFTYLSGNPDREPIAPSGYVGEYLLGLNAAVAALALLLGREAQGVVRGADVSGQQTAASLLENAIGLFLADGTTRMRAGNGYYTGTPAVSVYDCRDGFISLALSGEHHWASLCAVLGRLDWLDDPEMKDWPSRVRRGQEIEAAIQDWCRVRDRAEVVETFQTYRLPVASGYSLAEVLSDPQHAARSYFRPVARLGKTYCAPRLPFVTSLWSDRETAAPLLGQHTRAVLRDWLGMSEAEAQSLLQRGIACQAQEVE